MTSKTKVKICGVRSADIYQTCIATKVDYVGLMMFPKSPRYITIDDAQKLLSACIPEGFAKPKTVAVTVNADDAFMETILSKLNPDYVQCHGDETPERIDSIKQRHSIKIIKAISVSKASDLQKTELFPKADAFLFDAKPAENNLLTGGNAISFDWNILHSYSIKKPWFLAGGLDIHNVKEAISLSQAKQIDLSSGVEIERGVKSAQKIQDLMALLS